MRAFQIPRATCVLFSVEKFLAAGQCDSVVAIQNHSALLSAADGEQLD